MMSMFLFVQEDNDTNNKLMEEYLKTHNKILFKFLISLISHQN